MDAKVTNVDVIEEYWAFDISDTVNGIGGQLGLLLGWSIYWVLYETYLVLERAAVGILFKDVNH